MSIVIKQHPYRIECDMCNSRDTLMISKPGIPARQYPTLCKKDFKEVVLAGMEYFKNEITLPVPDDYERLKAENERLGNELEAAKSEINRLNVELEAATTEINRLTVELAAREPKADTAFATPTTVPGKGGKRK